MDPLLGEVSDHASARSTARSRARRTRFTFVDGSSQGGARARRVARLSRTRRSTTRRSSSRAAPTGLEMILKLLYVLLGFSRGRQPVRHGQHARARGLRAHARARDAAGGRHDAPPGAPHDPPRERHHGADRRGDGHPARALPRRARHPGAVEVRRRRCRSRCPSSSRSRWWRSSPACSRRSSRRAARRASTCSTRCSTSRTPGSPGGALRRRPGCARSRGRGRQRERQGLAVGAGAQRVGGADRLPEVQRHGVVGDRRRRSVSQRGRARPRSRRPCA